MQTAICLLLVVFFLLMNAFFVIAEFALVRVRKSQIDMAVAEKRRGAEAARDVTTHVVVGELIPKSFAIFATEKYALHTAGPLRVFYRITYPIMVIFNGITNGVMRLFGHDPADEHEVYTGEEIKLLIDESTESGLIDPEQNEFVDNIFDLGDKDAEGIMTPRTDVICLDLEDTLEENWDVVRQYKYTRYPVCDGSKDRIVGFVHTKDLVDEPKDAPMSDWKIRELPPVPEGAPIAKLLQAMQEGRTEMCVVVDEHGGTAGIVTMSDIMEQIVGRIDDEYVHDTDDDIEELPDGTYQINGTLAIDDLVELLGFEPEAANDVETAGGLLLSLFDRIPKEGDVAVLEDRGTKVTFTVLAMDRLRIDRICMAIDRPEEE